MPPTPEFTPFSTPPPLSEEEKARALLEVQALETKIKEIENLRDHLKSIKDSGNEEEIAKISVNLRHALGEGRKLKRKMEGKETPSTISVTYTRTKKDKDGKETKEFIPITLDIEKLQEEYQKFYETHGIPLSKEFTERMQTLWDDNYESLESAIKEKGFDTLLLVPENLNSTTLHEKMGAGYEDTWQGNNFKEGGSFSGVKEETRSRLVLLHSVEGISDIPELSPTLYKTAQTFLDSKEPLTLTDYLIFQRKQFEETGKHVDSKEWTWLPGSHSGARVVCARWDPGGGRLGVGASDPDYSDPDVGCRLSRSFL